MFLDAFLRPRNLLLPAFPTRLISGEVMDVFFAALPIGFLIFVMTKKNGLPSTVAFALAALLTYLVRIWYFQTSPNLAHAAVVNGLLQALQPLPFNWHSKPATPLTSVPVKVNTEVIAAVGEMGADVIDVSGAVVSINQVCVAGVVSVMPAGSTARTAKALGPSIRPV